MNQLELINAINGFDNTDHTFSILKDAICEVSENEELKNQPLVKELLYLGTKKLRTFGYNVMNDLTIEVIDSGEEDSANLLEYNNLVVREYYSSSSGLLLDKKQKKAINYFRDRRRLFLSAPTSFGKTFILREIIIENTGTFDNIVLIFPTLSLLNENVIEFKKFVTDNGLDYRIISNTHMDFSDSWKNIFILTPERMLKLIDQHPALNIDFFFMDEVYKIDNFFNVAANNDVDQENDRDKVFRIALYYLANRVSNFYLAGPYIDFDNINLGLQRFKDKYDVKFYQVKNELIKKEYFEAWKTKVKINGVEVSLRDQGKPERFRTLLGYIHNNSLGPTITYGFSKNNVTTLARESLSILPEMNNMTEGLARFKNHLTQRYSVRFGGQNLYKLWTFVSGLEQGIGIHHGSFPKYIQNEVLHLFNEGEIKYLYATTSITEGVNTKAKNILFYGSSKGGKKFKSFDVKNINGRAGRYYHHFRGRIFYFDKKVADIASATDEGLDFITFGEEEITAIDIDNTDIQDLSSVNQDKKREREEAVSASGVDPDVLRKNRLVDQLKQIELINLLLAHSDDHLKEIVRKCSSISAFLTGHSHIYDILDHFQQIGLLNEWEVGKYGKVATEYSKPSGMKRLIRYQLDNFEGTINEEAIDKMYVTVFSDIRNIVEFKVPKYLSIFGNLLEYVCVQRNIDSTALSIESIIRFYELGVRSDFGTYLAESGFPIPTIKELENTNIEIMDQSYETISQNFAEYQLFFREQLDDFEYYLLRKLL